MDGLELLIDLHRGGTRQGPGGDEETLLAIRLSGLKATSDLHVADIGCGTGASALCLAKALNAEVTAVDFLPDFLNLLEEEAVRQGLGEKIKTVAASMEKLPFSDNSLDAIWAEGAIYNMGFEAGIRTWRPFLKTGGILAVSELTWLTQDRPDELSEHWNREYPEVATASEKIALLEAHGYAPVGYFTLGKHCWLENYYRPMQGRFESFLQKHQYSEEAKNLVAAEQGEIKLYERFSDYVSYGFYIARKIGQ